MLPTQATRNATDGRWVAECAAKRAIAERRTGPITAAAEGSGSGSGASGCSEASGGSEATGGNGGSGGSASGSTDAGGASGSGSGGAAGSNGVHSPLHRAHRTTRPTVIS